MHKVVCRFNLQKETRISGKCLLALYCTSARTDFDRFLQAKQLRLRGAGLRELPTAGPTTAFLQD